MLLIYRTYFAVSDTMRSLSCTFPSPEGRDPHPHYYVVVTGLRKKNEFVSRLRSNKRQRKENQPFTRNRRHVAAVRTLYRCGGALSSAPQIGHNTCWSGGGCAHLICMCSADTIRGSSAPHYLVHSITSLRQTGANRKEGVGQAY